MTGPTVISAIAANEHLTTSGKRLLTASYLARIAGAEVPPTEVPADVQRLREWALSSGWYARAVSALGGRD